MTKSLWREQRQLEEEYESDRQKLLAKNRLLEAERDALFVEVSEFRVALKQSSREPTLKNLYNSALRALKNAASEHSFDYCQYWNEALDYEESEADEADRLRVSTADLERELKTAVDAIELITSTADSVRAKNTPEFMEYFADQIKEAKVTWAELGGKDKDGCLRG